MKIRRVCEDDRKVLRVIAFGILEPLYGDQSKALHEWISGEGFKYAFALVSKNNEVAGFLSLKANPANLYLKISTLLIFDGHKKLGYGKKLLAKAIHVAEELGFKKIKVTVSDSKQESLNFFTHADFIIVDKKLGKYRQDATEIILEMEVI